MDTSIITRQTNRNANLHAAAIKQNDEFYTKYNDIAEELKHYTHHFENKVVFCNCDDPEWSKFWQYFETKFHQLKLKKLMSTHYNRDGSPSYALMYEGNDDEKGNPIHSRIELTGNGDFASDECVELLKQSDIVVTNPPFSIAREKFIPMLMEYEKKFLIVGDDNWITYKCIFPLIRDNKIWKGFNHLHSFIQPDGTEKSFGNKSWFTNLDNDVRHRKLILLEDTDLSIYPKYDNYDAIDIGRLNDKGEWKADLRFIPANYDGIMGVPITFIDKYNPDQFEIIGYGSGSFGIEIGVKGYKDEYIKMMGNTAPVKGNLYYVIDGKPVTPYKRLLIKRKDT